MRKDVFLGKLCPNLDVRDILNCCGMNHYYHTYLQEPVLWFYLCKRDFNVMTGKTVESYKTCHRLRLFARDAAKSYPDFSMANENGFISPQDYHNISHLLTVTSMKTPYSYPDRIPRHIEEFPLLTSLHFNGNNFDHIPKEIYGIHSLTSLDMSENWISNISCQVSKLVNLKCLRMVNNLLSDLPKTIVDLSQLEILMIDVNRIKTLPSSMYKLQCLVHLLLRSNLLSCLPREIAEISTLKWLDVRNNKLTSIPRQFGTGSLRFLASSGNNILIVPPDLRKFEHNG